MRGAVGLSKSHYLALASVNGCCIEVLLDSGGSTTMIDRETAKLMGLDIEWAG
jgi:predicted aspartyl protease